MWCKQCNIETNADICPVCGGTTVEDLPVEVYWCDSCKIPIINTIIQADKGCCPVCGGKTEYLSADLRPVFPEERLLVELLLEKEPNSLVNESLWASNNRYYINGKSIAMPNSKYECANINSIIEKLHSFSAANSYDGFNKYITGTSAEKRPQFMKMVEDARQKKFNMIITREVSRFARNTVDTLQYTRLLKEYGVEVFFLNDNIKTFDGDGELRLTIMATLAQDESRKTSIRVKAGQETSMQNGVFYGNGNILGYDRVGKEMVINPEQAKTVRMIYDMYLSGMGVTTIQYELEKAGRLTALGKEQWFASYISKMLRNSFYCGIITYHKEYTPDFLKQKKIKNYGDLEYVQVQGTHEPIVTVEEYEQVQKLMDAKSVVLKNHNKGKRKTGRMQHTTVYGRLMICQCGNKFNLRFHSRDGRTDGVDYQCYTSVNRGSVAKRLNKGISIEHSCESPYIQGWKLEMMAEQVFDRYIENADKVMDLSYAMLEKHIADQEELPDNTDVIRRKQGEIEKLMNKRTNLIEMRAEGDIDKEMFRSKKQEIEDRVAKLTEEIKGLQPEKEQTSNEDYSVKLLELRERLKEYTGFDYSVIPESIVEAFIERIWVSKDEFRWYLRTGNNADGEFDPDDHIKIGAFTLTIDDAKKYIYSFSTRRRVYKWADLNVSVWI